MEVPELRLNSVVKVATAARVTGYTWKGPGTLSYRREEKQNA